MLPKRYASDAPASGRTLPAVAHQRASLALGRAAQAARRGACALPRAGARARSVKSGLCPARPPVANSAVSLRLSARPPLQRPLLLRLLLPRLSTALPLPRLSMALALPLVRARYRARERLVTLSPSTSSSATSRPTSSPASPVSPQPWATCASCARQERR